MILEPTLTSPALARAYCDGVLGSSGNEERSQEARLIVSELVTNAIVHAGTEIELNVVVTSGAIRIEVTDLGAGLPKSEDPVVGSSGRGVPIVEALSCGWGVVELGAGKTVWCELTL
jgi:sigma-B regulation protein RsbU (phosphoserine phosphatase)